MRPGFVGRDREIVPPKRKDNSAILEYSLIRRFRTKVWPAMDEEMQEVFWC
mgnify:FL=1